jgi:hypothetical protein
MRNTVSLYPSLSRVGRLQSLTTEMQVEEDGKSEGQVVMIWIGVESLDNITTHESEQTSIWSFNAKKQMLTT